MNELYQSNAPDMRSEPADCSALVSRLEASNKKLKHRAKALESRTAESECRIKALEMELESCTAGSECRIKALEMELEQLKFFLQAFVMQQQTIPQQQSAWWKNVVAKSIPPVLTAIGATAIKSLMPPQSLPRSYYPLYGSDKK